MSTMQIASKLGVSKSTVIKILHQAGIRPGSGRRMTSKDNYRGVNPPFGYRVGSTGELVSCPRESKILKKIIYLRDEEGRAFLQIARILEKENLKNRSGNCKWHSGFLSKQYLLWKEKIKLEGAMDP